MLEVQTERVLVVPTELFRSLGYFQGFSSNVDRYVNRPFDPAQTSYRPRAEVEHDPAFKQLIPYVIFRHRDAAGQTSLFQYTRGKGQGEARLHSKRSVGIGGHIAADDGISDCSRPYAEGMRRELEEEVIVDTPLEMHCVGLINDDETPVGRSISASCTLPTSSARRSSRGRAKSSKPASARSSRCSPIWTGSKAGRRFACGHCSNNRALTLDSLLLEISAEHAHATDLISHGKTEHGQHRAEDQRVVKRFGRRFCRLKPNQCAIRNER